MAPAHPGTPVATPLKSSYRPALKAARTEHISKLIDNNQNNPRFLFSTVARLTNNQMSPDLNIPSQFNSNDFMNFFTYNRRLQLGLGCPVGGQSGVRLLVSPGATPAYQPSRDVGGFLGPEHITASFKRSTTFWSGRVT